MSQNRKRIRGEEEPDVVEESTLKESTPTIMIESPFTDKEHFIRSYVRLQSESALPAEFWKSDVARLFFAPFERAYNVSVNEEDLKDDLPSKCATTFKELKQRLRGRMVCLKLDAVPTTNRVDLMSVSVQFLENYHIRIAHLGWLDLRTHYEVPEYHEDLDSLLDEYGLRIDSIYSTTVDYAAYHFINNYTKATPCSKDLEEGCIVGLDNSSWLGNLLYWTLKEEPGEFSVETPTYFRSAVQVIHAGIYQWLIPYLKDLVAMVAVHKGCEENFYRDYDCTPNIGLWSTTFTMLDDLKRTKEEKASALTKKRWTLVDKLWRALKPCQEMMEDGIKSQQYTCGDLMRDMIECEMKMQQHKDKVSKDLLEVMKIRKAMLLENIQFQAALFLDPRFNNCCSEILSVEQKSNVVTYLLKVYKKMKEVEKRAIKADATVADGGGSSNPQTEISKTSGSVDFQDLQMILDDLEAQAEPGQGFQIKEYWQTHSHPQLKELANVVLAHPVSKIPVRGDFEFSQLLFKSKKEEDLKTLMKIFVAHTADM